MSSRRLYWMTLSVPNVYWLPILICSNDSRDEHPLTAELMFRESLSLSLSLFLNDDGAKMCKWSSEVQFTTIKNPGIGHRLPVEQIEVLSQGRRHASRLIWSSTGILFFRAMVSLHFLSLFKTTYTHYQTLWRYLSRQWPFIRLRIIPQLNWWCPAASSHSINFVVYAWCFHYSLS